MKKHLLVILVSLFLTIGLTGCYTELLTTNAALASDNPENTTIIYYPVPVPSPDPAPGYPHPAHPQPVYSPITQPNNPGNKNETKRTETTLRNDNGGRGNAPRNVQPQRSTRIEPANNSGNTSSNSSGNNTSSRTENSNNNSPRNNSGSRNTNGGR